MKSDGLKIAIEFSEELIGDVSGNESAFLISFHQYNKTPGGLLEGVTRTVQSVEIDGSNPKILYLNFASGNVRSIQNAVGLINVEYANELGTLRGRGGPVSGFSWDFTPEDLQPKFGVNDIEHIEYSMEADITLTAITYHNSKSEDENINYSMNASIVLTNIRDL